MTFAEIQLFFTKIARSSDGAIDLAEAALVIAQTAYPDLERSASLLRIDDLAGEARLRVGDERESYAVANILSEYLFDEIGLAGNAADYYDPRNSFLNDVLERKLGIPITLCVIYLEVGRRLGMPVTGAGMPGHFLVRYRAEDGDFLLDPFHRGVILMPEDLQQLAAAAGMDAGLSAGDIPAVSPCEILARMLNNLKSVYLERREFDRCLQMVELALCITPDSVHDLQMREQLLRLV